MPQRAKAVRRPKLRSYLERGSLTEVIRKRFEDPAARFFAMEFFWKDLPTPQERAAYAQVYPESFYKKWDFFSHESDEWPASTMYTLRGIFRRPPEEFLAMLEQHPPRRAFEPPDLSCVPYPEQRNVLARARGEWWKQNGWPITTKEAEFLRHGPKELKKEAESGP